MPLNRLTTFFSNRAGLKIEKISMPCGFSSSPSGKLAGADAAAPRDVDWPAAHEGIMPSEEEAWPLIQIGAPRPKA